MIRAEEFEYWELEYAQRARMTHEVTGYWPSGAKFDTAAAAEEILVTEYDPRRSTIVAGHDEPLWRIAHVRTRREYSDPIHVANNVRKPS